MLGFLFPSVPSPKSREKFVGTASPATFLAKGRKGRRPRQLFLRKDARDGVPDNFSCERTQGTASLTTFLAKGNFFPAYRKTFRLLFPLEPRLLPTIHDRFSCQERGNGLLHLFAEVFRRGISYRQGRRVGTEAVFHQLHVEGCLRILPSDARRVGIVPEEVSSGGRSEEGCAVERLPVCRVEGDAAVRCRTEVGRNHANHIRPVDEREAAHLDTCAFGRLQAEVVVVEGFERRIAVHIVLQPGLFPFLEQVGQVFAPGILQLRDILVGHLAEQRLHVLRRGRSEDGAEYKG